LLYADLWMYKARLAVVNAELARLQALVNFIAR
jgi:hypothetical protein